MWEEEQYVRRIDLSFRGQRFSYNAAMGRGEEKVNYWQFSIRHLLALTAVFAVAFKVPIILVVFIYLLVFGVIVGLFLVVAILFSRVLLWLFPNW